MADESDVKIQKKTGNGDEKDLVTEESTDKDDKKEALPHQEAMAKVHNSISKLIGIDPLLKDLPVGVTLEEINSAIAVEYGQAMIVNVVRADGDVYKVVVIQDATVQDLKNAIKRHVTLRQSRRGGTTHISWKYIWKRYWLYFDGQKLTDDHSSLKSYGIRSRSEVSFIQKLIHKRKEPDDDWSRYDQEDTHDSSYSDRRNTPMQMEGYRTNYTAHSHTMYNS